LSTPDTASTVGDVLGVPVRIAAGDERLAPDALYPAERARFDSLPTEARRRDWLLGRSALKALVGAAFDTAALSFPHPRLSLTHAGGTAFAVMAGETVVGTGVDFEPDSRAVDPRAARFFLDPAERAAACTGGDLLRLWTVKEALFKATPGNARVVLADYALDDPAAACGSATGPRDEDLRYATVAAAGGVLTVAVCLPRRRHRVAV
jgi:hypothetical protein